MAKRLTATEKFFAEHAGFARLPEQSEAAAKAQSARELAYAEQRATEAGVAFSWTRDPEITSADHEESDEAPYALWMCTAYDDRGTVVASLGGIDFGRDEDGAAVEPWGQPYRRVVEAELAREAVGTGAVPEHAR